MATTTVRVSEDTRSKLRQLAEETGGSMQAVLDQALDAYRRERFFMMLDEAYAALWADPVAREEKLAEPGSSSNPAGYPPGAPALDDT